MEGAACLSPGGEGTETGREPPVTESGGGGKLTQEYKVSTAEESPDTFDQEGAEATCPNGASMPLRQQDVVGAGVTLHGVGAEPIHGVEGDGIRDESYASSSGIVNTQIEGGDSKTDKAENYLTTLGTERGAFSGDQSNSGKETALEVEASGGDGDVGESPAMAIEISLEASGGDLDVEQDVGEPTRTQPSEISIGAGFGGAAEALEESLRQWTAGELQHIGDLDVGERWVLQPIQEHVDMDVESEVEGDEGDESHKSPLAAITGAGSVDTQCDEDGDVSRSLDAENSDAQCDAQCDKDDDGFRPVDAENSDFQIADEYTTTTVTMGLDGKPKVETTSMFDLSAKTNTESMLVIAEGHGVSAEQAISAFFSMNYPGIDFRTVNVDEYMDPSVVDGLVSQPGSYFGPETIPTSNAIILIPGELATALHGKSLTAAGEKCQDDSWTTVGKKGAKSRRWADKKKKKSGAEAVQPTLTFVGGWTSPGTSTTLHLTSKEVTTKAVLTALCATLGAQRHYCDYDVAVELGKSILAENNAVITRRSGKIIEIQASVALPIPRGTLEYDVSNIKDDEAVVFNEMINLSEKSPGSGRIMVSCWNKGGEAMSAEIKAASGLGASVYIENGGATSVAYEREQKSGSGKATQMNDMRQNMIRAIVRISEVRELTTKTRWMIDVTQRAKTMPQRIFERGIRALNLAREKNMAAKAACAYFVNKVSLHQNEYMPKYQGWGRSREGHAHYAHKAEDFQFRVVTTYACFKAEAKAKTNAASYAKKASKRRKRSSRSKKKNKGAAEEGGTVVLINNIGADVRMPDVMAVFQNKVHSAHFHKIGHGAPYCSWGKHSVEALHREGEAIYDEFIISSAGRCSSDPNQASCGFVTLSKGVDAQWIINKIRSAPGVPFAIERLDEDSRGWRAANQSCKAPQGGCGSSTAAQAEARGAEAEHEFRGQADKVRNATQASVQSAAVEELKRENQELRETLSLLAAKVESIALGQETAKATRTLELSEALDHFRREMVDEMMKGEAQSISALRALMASRDEQASIIAANLAAERKAAEKRKREAETTREAARHAADVQREKERDAREAERRSAEKAEEEEKHEQRRAAVEQQNAVNAQRMDQMMQMMATLSRTISEQGDPGSESGSDWGPMLPQRQGLKRCRSDSVPLESNAKRAASPTGEGAVVVAHIGDGTEGQEGITPPGAVKATPTQ